MERPLVLPLVPFLLALSPLALPGAADVTLVQSTPAEIGASMMLAVTGASPGAPIYLLLSTPLGAAPSGAAKLAVPSSAGPSGLVLLGTASGSGALTAALPIPASSALLGLVLPMRALDAAAQTTNGSGLSNRLAAWIGPHPVTVSPAPELYGGYGWSVAIGDFLGTGELDLAVGAVLETVSGAFGAGRVHVYEGPSFTSVTTLTSPAPQIGGDFGWSLAALDWDGDGTTDLAVGEPGHDGVSPLANIGAVEVFLHPVGAGGVIVLGDPSPVANEQMGVALAAAQLDASPAHELVAGASFHGASQPADVLATIKILADSGGLATITEIAEPNLSGGNFGDALAAGDTDGDGLDEILVGEPNHDVTGATGAGAAHLIDQGACVLSLLDDAPAFGEHFGSSLAIGDLDGDGLGDLLVGVVLENDAQLYVAPAFGGPIVLATAHPGDIHGGRAVAVADVNGDGALDALVAAGSCSAPGFGVVCGSVTAHLGPALQRTAYVADWEIAPWALAAGDVDGDGRDELAVGHPNGSPGFVSGAGAVLLCE